MGLAGTPGTQNEPEGRKNGTLNPATQCPIGLLASLLLRTQGFESPVGNVT